MIRLLHISDVHINKSFATKDEVLRHRMQRAVIRSFQNAITYCISNDLDALMIAGDLFDSQQVSLKDGELVKDAFEQLKKHDIKVFYASGNHDFTHYDSKIRHLDYPSNVKTFFGDDVKTYELHDRITHDIYKVVGCGHVMQHESRPLIENFPVGKHIGLAHSMVASPITKGDEGDYLPSTIDTLTSKGYLYFALGHIHQNGPIDKHETIYYAGALQGLNSNETGVKGGNLVTINDGQVDVKFVALAVMSFEKMDIDITGLDTMDALFESTKVELGEYLKDLEQNKLSIEIKFTGRSKLYKTLKNSHEISDLRLLILDYFSVFDIKIKSDVKTVYDAESYKNKRSVLGEVLKAVDDISINGLPKLNYLSTEPSSSVMTEGMEDQIMTYFLEGYDED
ncbi:MAG: metallophosphoesterase [Clostridiales bacterium]|nr:metallophosphoesterase [Clostridiales bacterium]